jgi:hypothetical protein
MNRFKIEYSRHNGSQIIHGLLDRIMQVLDVKRHATEGYTLKPSDGAPACCLSPSIGYVVVVDCFR